MVFHEKPPLQQNPLEKNIFHCQNVCSGHGPAGQFWLLESTLRKQPTFRDATTGFLAKWRLRNECRNSILMPTQIWLVPLICRPSGIFAIMQNALGTRVWKWRVISMDFLRSFLRRHFAGKPVVASLMSAVFRVSGSASRQHPVFMETCSLGSPSRY